MVGRMDTVSIIIPCYNHAHYLADAIDSARAQSHPCEVIVIDDGSTDETADIALGYPDVKLIMQPNMGLAAARNSGIGLARGYNILPLDADDKLDPTFVEKALPHLRGDVKIVDSYVQHFGDFDTVIDTGKVDSVFDILGGNRVTCCALFTKASWTRAGGYDENMTLGYEDWEFWIRVLATGGRVHTIPEPLFFYRKHGASMIDSTTRNAARITAYMRDKHRDLYGAMS